MSYVNSYAYISSDARDGSVDQCGLEGVDTGVGGANDGLFLLAVGEVLAAYVEREMAEVARHLGGQVLVGPEVGAPRGRAVAGGVGAGQAAAAVEGEGGVQLPEFQRVVVGGAHQGLVAALQRFPQALAAIRRLHEVVAVGRCNVQPLGHGVGGVHNIYISTPTE